MGSEFDLLGCEYLGGCPIVGQRVLNKVELHFGNAGLGIAIATQGLFTLAFARPVLNLTWPEITVLSTTCVPQTPRSARRLARATANLLAMRLNLPNQLMVATPEWTMTVGVRVPAAELATAIHELLAGCDGPVPAVNAN